MLNHEVEYLAARGGTVNHVVERRGPPRSVPSTAAGSEDFHLAAGAAALDRGVDLGALFDTDVDGDTRTAPWDIGADER
jgi:hypothetical protein